MRADTSPSALSLPSSLLPFTEMHLALGPGSLGRKVKFWSACLLIFFLFSLLGLSASYNFLSLSASPEAPLPIGPSFSFDLLEQSLLLRTCTLFWEPPLPTDYLPSLSTVAAAQIIPGEKSTHPLCHASLGTVSIPKMGFRILKYPQQLSRSPFHLSAPNRSPQRIWSPLQLPISLTALFTKLKP